MISYDTIEDHSLNQPTIININNVINITSGEGVKERGGEREREK